MTETTILFDRLRFIDKLTGAGIPEPQARAHADAMDEALRESVATKRDIAEVLHKIDLTARDTTIRLGGLIAAGVGLLVALKYFG